MEQNWDMDFIYKGPLQNRVSCTMGELPSFAVCNMVGDQPLFYIADSADAEDMALMDELFGDESFTSDESLIASLRSRIEAYDNSARSVEVEIMEPTTTSFDKAFQADQKSLSLSALIEKASISGTFRSYYAHLTQNAVSFELSQNIAGATYDRVTKTVKINTCLSDNRAICLMIRAMRLAWHHTQGTLMNPLRFQPEDVIVMNRLSVADQDVAMVAVAWDLRLAGLEDVWATLMNSPDHDLCVAYAMEAMMNFRSIASGLAARASFEKWFISGRCKSLDRQIIQLMLSHNADYIFEDEDVSRMIATDTIAKVGARPMGKNYLTPIVTNVMTDGLYTDVRDRANANFLWFIQFEKKMGEAEQSLQQGGKLSEAVSGTTAQGSNNGNADIITFPSHASHTTGRASDDGMGASVYYIDHFRAL